MTYCISSSSSSSSSRSSSSSSSSSSSRSSSRSSSSSSSSSSNVYFMDFIIFAFIFLNHYLGYLNNLHIFVYIEMAIEVYNIYISMYGYMVRIIILTILYTIICGCCL